ncbi:MAG: sensor histidine kinase [Acidimicrobiales bacterium]
MRSRLLVGFILFAVLATALLLVPIGFTLDAHENANTLSALRRDTNALATILSNDIARNNLVQAKKLAKSYAHSTGRQILVLDSAGILFASKAKQATDQSLLAIANEVGTTQLFGVTTGSLLESPQYYVAMSLSHATNPNRSIDDVKLIVTFPVKVVTKVIRSDWRNLALVGFLMLAVACLLGVAISSSLVRPLRKIGRAVDAIGNGELDVRVPDSEGPTELRRLAQAINATTARLITLLEAQRTFVEDASHQLRTPLTALQLHLENFQTADAVSSSADVTSVLSEVGRLNRLVDSLLALARNESRSPVLEALRVHDLVVDRVEYWRPYADEHGLDLESAVPNEVSVVAVGGALEQILDNLLSNAFDATSRGGKIRVTVLREASKVELHVIDTGVGLTREEREFAVRRFWRGRHADHEGSGLGLAIVDQLVRLSGGSFELRKASGGGIDATVVLRAE